MYQVPSEGDWNSHFDYTIGKKTTRKRMWLDVLVRRVNAHAESASATE